MSSTESLAPVRIRGGRVIRERSSRDAASAASGMNSASATGGAATVTLQCNRNPGPLRYPLPTAPLTLRESYDQHAAGRTPQGSPFLRRAPRHAALASRQGRIATQLRRGRDALP